MTTTAKTKQRTCIVCRESNSKKEFLRVVRQPDGEVNFDPTGRANGRGAYVCSVACFERAVKTRRLESALRKKLTKEDYERISEQLIQALSDGNN